MSFSTPHAVFLSIFTVNLYTDHSSSPRTLGTLSYVYLQNFLVFRAILNQDLIVKWLWIMRCCQNTKKFLGTDLISKNLFLNWIKLKGIKAEDVRQDLSCRWWEMWINKSLGLRQNGGKKVRNCLIEKLVAKIIFTEILG